MNAIKAAGRQDDDRTHVRLNRSTQITLFALMTAAGALATAADADAAMSLTSAGMGRGFTLSTFASGFPQNGGGAGPFGIAYLGSTVIVTDDDGSIYRFPNHVDGQTAGTALATHYAGASLRSFGQMTSGYYLARQSNADVIQINPATGAMVRTVAFIPGGALGIAPFPPNPSPPLGGPSPHAGHLFVSSANGNVYEVNPSQPTNSATTLFATNTGVSDGIAIDESGLHLYVAHAASNTVRGFDITSAQTTGAPIFVSDPITLGIDGIALGLGCLKGFLYVNLNDGTLWEVGGIPNGPDPLTPVGAVKIATGGSRGDFIAIDPYVLSSGGAFPTLLLTQSQTVMRLSGVGGCGFVGPSTSSAAPVLTAVGHWPFDELSGVIASDAAGTSPASFQGSPTRGNGRVGAAVHLVQPSDFVETAVNPSVDVGSGSFSVNAWVRTASAATSVRTIVDKRGSSSGLRGFSLAISFGRLIFQMADAVGFTNYGTPAAGQLTDGAWHHVAATVDRLGGASGGNLYIDGVLSLTFDPTAHAGSLSNTNSLRMGQAFDTSSIGFNGDLDDVEVYQSVLTPAEILRMANAPTAVQVPIVPAVGNWGSTGLAIALALLGALWLGRRRTVRA